MAPPLITTLACLASSPGPLPSFSMFHAEKREGLAREIMRTARRHQRVNERGHPNHTANAKSTCKDSTIVRCVDHFDSAFARASFLCVL